MEDGLEVVEAERDDVAGGEEPLPAGRRAWLPGRRRAGGGVPDEADPGARRRTAAAAGVLGGWLGDGEEDARRVAGRRDGVVELRRGRHLGGSRVRWR